ncbi:hypothetical protein AVEN_160396-1 [Araneus ventricosus]|uniref:Uncharacterized protein n=1 Tax=Araneus ventricosus TaxID=182803 RepID=A0A4Y2ELM3_ARAVE|nr:hypothetical protein AVEN_8120-1 [Araneus ventricosus]GBM30180.1 hypothetical protein AVEN_249316-1 [Araneus ventricosus]GBM30193.1 hypothetical protein AVEN_8694-1 [Araneus ventricosus]GBM30615.1 hypothetical protein AVEN_160396-1 [Araneus ventricosus]
MRYARKPLTAPPGCKFGVSVLISKTVRNTGKKLITKLFSIIDILQKNLAHKTDTNEKHKTNICLIAFNKTALAGKRLIYLPCSKCCPSATIHIWTRDCTSLCTLYDMAGYTLAQASVIRFRSSCYLGGGFTCTRCLMYPHRKQ